MLDRSNLSPLAGKIDSGSPVGQRHVLDDQIKHRDLISGL